MPNLPLVASRQFRHLYRAALFYAAAGISAVANASATSGQGGLPWESPLTTIRNSITGPVAFVVSAIAIVAAGATLAWGGEISGFARTVIILVLVISLMVGGLNVLTTLFPAAALI